MNHSALTSMEDLKCAAPWTLSLLHQCQALLSLWGRLAACVLFLTVTAVALFWPASSHLHSLISVGLTLEMETFIREKEKEDFK